MQLKGYTPLCSKIFGTPPLGDSIFGRSYPPPPTTTFNKGGGGYPSNKEGRGVPTMKGVLLKTTTLLVFFLWLVKSLKNLWTIDCCSPREMWPFFWFPNGFRPSRSTTDLLTVVPDRIARAFNRSGAARAVVVDISNAFDRV